MKGINLIEKYQLRHAAGIYWLLDMSQSGFNYKKPVPMNETGATLWKLLEKGYSKEQLIEYLCNEYGIESNEASKDIEVYYNNLRQYGIII